MPDCQMPKQNVNLAVEAEQDKLVNDKASQPIPELRKQNELNSNTALKQY